MVLAPRRAASAASNGGAGLLEDLAEACPCQWPSWGLVLQVVSFACALYAAFKLPALRVGNGSADSCDPVATYGEITERGMASLFEALGDMRHGTFLDVGSGFGKFPRWACRTGGFRRCIGIEVARDRHAQALAEEDVQGVTFVLGDVVSHPEVFDDVQLVWWNNLCFPADLQKAVMEQFSSRAPVGAEIWVLAALPHVPGVEQAPSLSSDAELRVPMGWRAEPYKLYRYVRRGGREL